MAGYSRTSNVRDDHRDAWVFGAADPASGMVALLDQARAVGELAGAGWRPARTIVYASWDAKEPGLLGSTEWVELHADELRDKAVAYINSDGNGRGFLTLSGSQSLERFVNHVARDVPDPQMDVSVAERGNALLRLNGDGARIVEGDHPVAPLGSGSDYTPFLQHLSIASRNIGYGGEDEGGSYHSIYDSYDHFLRFGDPNLDYGTALAMTGGRATLRLAEAPVLPFRFSNLARRVDTYVKEVKELTDRMRTAAEETNERIASGAYTLASDPLNPLKAPERKDPVPYLNFAPLENALADLKTSAGACDAALLEAGPDEASPESKMLVLLNERLFRTERALTREEGLSRRSWIRHQIYAPGFYTGYGVTTLPGVREAIEERHWSEAEEQIRRLAETLTQAAATYRQAVELLTRE